MDLEGIHPGELWWEQIERAIESAGAFVPLLSPAMLRSGACRRELDHAMACGKRLLTVLAEPVDEADVPPAVAERQWLLSAVGAPGVDLETFFEAIDADPAWLRAHTRLLEQARSWEARNRSEALLLDGDPLAEAETWLGGAGDRRPRPTTLQREFIARSRQVQRIRRAINLARAPGDEIAGLVEAVAGAGPSIAAGEEPPADALHALVRTVALARRSFPLRTAEGERQPRFSADGRRIHLGAEDRDAVGLRRLEPLPDAVRPEGAVAADARTVLTRDGGVLSVGDRDSGRVRFELELQPAYNLAIDLAHDGEQVRAIDSGAVRVWDARTGAPRFTIPAPRARWFTSVATSPDGRWIATATGTRRARLWDAVTGEEGPILQAGRDDPEIEHVAFSPGGRYVVTRESASSRLWHVQDGTRVPGFDTESFHHVLSFSGGAKYILTLGFTSSAPAIWSAEGPQYRFTLRGHGAEVHDTAFAAGEDLVATASEDGTARVWELSGGTLVAVLEGHAGPVTHAEFSADGRKVLTAGVDGVPRLHDLEPGGAVERIPGAAPPGISADGRVVQVEERRTRIVDPLGGRDSVELDDAAAAPLEALITPAGAVVARGGDAVSVFDARDGRLLRTLGTGENVVGLRVSRDGARILAVTASGTAVVWGLDDGRVLLRAGGGERRVRGAELSADGRRVITTEESVRDDRGQTTTTPLSDARVWDVDAGPAAEPRVVLAGHERYVDAAAFAPDGERALTVSADGMVRLWEGPSARPIATLGGGRVPGTAASFSPDGSLVLTVHSDRTVRVWSVTTARLAVVLKGHANAVWAAAITDDNRHAVTLDRDALSLWELAGGQLIWRFSQPAASAVSLSVSSDGLRVLAAPPSYNFRDVPSHLYRLDLRYWFDEACRLLRNEPEFPEVASTVPLASRAPL